MEMWWDGFCGKARVDLRALGNRSILGDRHPEVQKTMNLKIKFRESFRPCCAMMTIEEDVLSYFEGIEKKPYMLLVSNINEVFKN